MRPTVFLMVLLTAGLVSGQTGNLCQQTIKSTSNTLRLGGFEDVATGRYDVQTLVPVYAGDDIDAYVDAHTIEEAVKINVRDGSFDARIYFVYREESARLSAVAEISRHTPIPPNKSCSVSFRISPQHPVDGAVSGIAYKRNQDCAEVNGTEEARINDLKYIMMKVGYRKAGVYGVALANGSGHIPGPLLYIYDTLYLAPRNCAKALKHDKPGQETIMALANPVSDFGPADSPTFIGRPRGANYNGKTTAPSWHPLIGDLVPVMNEFGFNPVKIGPDSTPFMFQILQQVNKTIQEKMVH
jgi:hypothetical protein